MGGVFANGLEISGKAVNAQTIAAFPDVCFTPPENPATPPGVPIPYPSFGMASDTEQGTSTVKIGNKTVNIKNKSDLSRTSGTEAGCAAKKGLITSKNTGKGYFNSWSNDVKFDGEPVIRMTDLATNNHASPTGNTVTWPHTAAITVNGQDCATILNNVGIHVHQHKDSDCQHPTESEHCFENQMFQRSRGGENYSGWGNYDVDTAPCICMESYKKTKTGYRKSGSGSKRGSPHNKKTKEVRDFLKKKRSPTLGDAIKKVQQAVGDHHEKLQTCTKQEKDDALECLKLVLLDYLVDCARAPKPTHAQLLAKPIRKK
ncbi:MAG: DUF4150 domain-containing protein [Mesorhizobium sp.]|uniref:DUF4150 domain-containing protein n=1 Tax=Mesorhizobium sp. TaxID=1871066 RepID=UPI000FE78EB9|nr:DUF4150 domain-containing protein [Mesorhizobium sp.]RWG53719.1 MAG: DUF4150 domain-containing protein [Mesorhizobium sp.]RWH41224.1 MAG: DUF4150 domain-containing protein [Mesorhizobium sp.]RWI17962.1 MAG: DUF4150 domain-containing protein [Mesorhizobium sp.]